MLVILKFNGILEKKLVLFSKNYGRQISLKVHLMDSAL